MFSLKYIFLYVSLTVIVLLWHYKQKETPKAWATFLQVLTSAFVGGVMIAIILAIVKTKDAVSFLHNIEKSLKSESSLRTNVVKEVKASNATSYYKIDEIFYWHKYKKISQNLQHVKVNKIS
jgi:MFS superfamily sulfate permease-like transporter